MSWNKDSRNDIKQLTEIYKELHPKGLEIVAVAFDRSKEQWQEFVSANHLPWIQIHDSKGINKILNGLETLICPIISWRVLT